MNIFIYMNRYVKQYEEGSVGSKFYMNLQGHDRETANKMSQICFN